MIDPLHSHLTPPLPELRTAGESSAQVADRFESLLVEMTIEEMRKTLPEDGLFASSALKMFEDVLDEALAEQIQRGGGLGLAESIASSLAQTPVPAEGRADPATASRAGSVRISSAYGMRRDPMHGGQRHHAGVDLSAPTGTPIRALRSGTVSFAGRRGGYGNLVILSHPDGSESRYAHCHALEVRKGDRLQTGEILGSVGATGRATGPHLHLEIRREGHSLDPLREHGEQDLLNLVGDRSEEGAEAPYSEVTP